MVVPLESIKSPYPDSPVCPTQVSITDSSPTISKPSGQHCTTAAQPIWGEWPQDFWILAEAAKEIAEDEALCTRLQAPQQPDASTVGTAEVYDWGDYPAKPMRGEVVGRPWDTELPPPERQPDRTDTQPGHCWLRNLEGRWQRRVLLNQLQQHKQYNGMLGWVDIEELEASAGGSPKLLLVHIESLNRPLHVNSSYLFLVSPNLLARPIDETLIIIEAQLNVQEGSPPVHARLVVDSGCQLEGVLSTDFVRRQGWQAIPLAKSICTADGRQIQGLKHIVANSHLAPGFTRQVDYGVLDLPGYDGLLGISFLNQFKPFAITVTSEAQRGITLTNPKTKQPVHIAGLGWEQFYGKPSEQSAVHEGVTQPQVTVQWEAPTTDDLNNIVSAFHISINQDTGQIHLVDVNGESDGDACAAHHLEEQMSADEVEGLVFLVQATAARYDHAPAEVRERLQAMLAKYQLSVFRECEYPPYPPTRDVKFNINLLPGAQVPASPVHKLAPALVDNLRKMLQELLHNGLIVPTSSPFAAPLLMVKKPDGSYRLCIDYRKLNAVTIKDRYPLPNPSMIFDRLSGCQFFSKLDLRWGYWQLRLEDPDDKTAFRSPLGSFAWKVMAMGLTNAAPTFQRLMDSIFRDLDFVSCYLDDIMIASKSAEEHLQHIETVLQRLEQHNLLARESKCAFFLSEVKFLGYVFSAQGKSVDSSKTEALCQLARPETVHELQRWLGQVNYYSMFIPKYAEMVAPLTDLLKGTSSTKKKRCLMRLEWQGPQQQAFEAVRAALATPPILKLFDPALPSKVAADASGVAVGGVLLQQHAEVWHPVAYYSRKLSPTEQRYTTRERECLAVKQCLVEWRHYLMGAPFTVLSDHESLKWLQTQGVATLSDRLLRWVEYFSLYDFQQEYIPGELNVFPDGLSRPATMVCVVLHDGQSVQWDLWTMAVRLDEKQAVVPSQSSLVAVLSETSFLTPFREDIVKAQDADPEYAAIKDKLRRGEGPPPAERMLFKLVDDCLVVPESDGSVRLVVPTPELQQAICRHGHDESGHQGVQRTLHAITTFFYWPNMQRMIRSYVTSCTVCQAAKPSNRLPAGVAEPISLMVEPGAHWTIDFMELPESANGFTRLLVFTDRVSKVAVLAPVRTATAVEVAEVFVQQVFCWFGMPQSFFSDKGPEFRSAVFHEICRMLGTTVKHSTSNTPHSHGDVERQNHIVNDVLRTMSQDQFPDLLAQWDEHVKLIQFTLNSAVVHRHGMSPLFFFFGRHPRIPLTADLPSSAVDPQSLEFVLSFQTRLRQALDVGREGQVQMVEAMDKLRDPTLQYKVGDWAWLAWSETPVPGDKHFQCKWMGPFKILATSISTVSLELPEHWQLTSNTFHVEKVRPYVLRDGQPLPPPRPRRFKARLPDELGTIRRISAHRRTGRLQADGRRAQLQYFVHWVGLPQAYGEWLNVEAVLLLPRAEEHISSYCRVFAVPHP